MKEVNGEYVVIAEETYRWKEGGVANRIVLAVRTVHKKEWATWDCIKVGKEIAYLYGHYFTNEKAALVDYHERLIERYKEDL